MTKLFDSTVEEVTRTVYGEGSVFVGKNYNALLAIAQCIKDQYDNGYGTLTQIIGNNFTGHSDIVNAQCRKAVVDVFFNGIKRLDSCQIIEFRSFTKYSDGNGLADPYRCATLFEKYDFLGSDSISNEWGHFYFGYRKDFTPYNIKIEIDDLNVRLEPSIDSKIIMTTGVGVFGIVDEHSGKTSKDGGIGLWGRLKSGAGWVSLNYCKKI